jgi:hypothetical protein
MNTDEPKRPEEGNQTPKPETEEETTPQQEAAYRYFVRLNQLFALALFVIALIFVAIFPTGPRIAGLIILAGLTVVTLLWERISVRRIGFAALAVAGITAIVTRFAHEGWPVEPDEIAKWAVGIGAIGVALIVTNKKSGEPNRRFENIVGTLALVSLLSVAGLVAVFGGAGTVANPAGLVALEALGAMAEMAGEKWKMRLALAALFPIAALLADHIQPAWLHRVFH